MKIEVGKKYKTADGRIVEITSRNCPVQFK